MIVVSFLEWSKRPKEIGRAWSEWGRGRRANSFIPNQIMNNVEVDPSS
jgi:hypothetical protein